MKTKITKMNTEIDKAKWSNYYHAGTTWLLTLELISKHRDEIGWSIFWVEPWMVAFCIELFTKAIVSYHENGFNAIKYKHKTSKIIREYSNKIDILKELISDDKIMYLITEYEKTIDTKYAETYLQLDGEEQKLLIAKSYELRLYLGGKTGLR